MLYAGVILVFWKPQAKTNVRTFSILRNAIINKNIK